MAMLLLMACGTDRPPNEAPFVTCPGVDLVADDGSWAGTGTVLIAPPDTFDRELVGHEVRVSLVAFEGVVDAYNAVVRDDGGLLVVVEAPDTNIIERPLRVEIAGMAHVVLPAASPAHATIHTVPAITEDPNDVMSFSATLIDPLEVGAFYSFSTTELRAIEADGLRVDAQLKGYAGHRAIVGLRTSMGDELCVRTPCGCSPRLAEQGLCGRTREQRTELPAPPLPMFPSNEPSDEPI